LPDLSNTIIVLVFSEWTSFVRKILQREENKGVELTVHGWNGLREGSSESEKKRKKLQLPHPCTTRKSGAPACLTLLWLTGFRSAEVARTCCGVIPVACQNFLASPAICKLMSNKVNQAQLRQHCTRDPNVSHSVVKNRTRPPV
jgi:hypothetical protein